MRWWSARWGWRPTNGGPRRAAKTPFICTGEWGSQRALRSGLHFQIPKTPVWVINSDGSLCMNTGCLITEAGQQPRNLKHFVVDNQCYQTVESMPMVNNGLADYAAMARGAGIAQAITITDLADLDRLMPEIVAAPGPYFVCLKVEAEPDYQRAPPANYEGPEMKYRFGRALENKLGIKVSAHAASDVGAAVSALAFVRAIMGSPLPEPAHAHCHAARSHHSDRSS